MRHCRHVTDNGVERHFRFVVVTEIIAPRIDLFLTRRVPGHLAAEGIRFILPAISAFFHQLLDLIRLLGPAFAFKISQQCEKDVAFHQSQLDVAYATAAVRRAAESELCRLIGLFEIPVPRMGGHQTRVIASHAIHRPIGGNHMWIVVTAANRFCFALLPA